MALQSVIDRRESGRHKSVGNRERFVRRVREQLRQAVRRAVDERGIRDIERGQEVQLPARTLHEPVFRHGAGGVREGVHAGNREHERGDRIERPPPAGGAGGAGVGATVSGG